MNVNINLLVSAILKNSNSQSLKRNKTVYVLKYVLLVMYVSICLQGSYVCALL